jgi:nucleotide-binding universal stress UspA family protein
MVNKVLVAIDGSDHAGKAVALAADIAAKYDAELILLHVLLHQELPRELHRLAEAEHLVAGDGRPMASSGLPVADLGTYLNLVDGNATLTEDALRLIGNKILENAENVAHGHGAKNVTKRVEGGNPVDTILQVAQSEKVDMIVTGARGLSNLKSIFAGSVSQKLAQRSPVTCVTVH